MSRMARRPFLAVATLVVVLGILSDAPVRATGNLEVITQGGNAIGNRKWHASSLPIVWSYNDPTTVGACNYNSTNAPAATLQPAHVAAFASWQDDPDSVISFTYGGTTAVRDIGVDGVNVMTFCDSDVLRSDPGFLARTPTTSLTAVTTVTAGGGCPAGQGLLDLNGPPPPSGFCFPAGTYPAGTIVDGDIEYNTFGANEGDFSTNHAIGSYDVQATATHEIGHFFGLSHDPILQAVMFPFIDDEPASDGLGQRILKRSDRGTAGRYYPAASYSTSYGSITGFISLDGLDADGVHVVAIDPNTLLAVAGRFSLSRFEDSAALGPEGPDFASNGTGFYRIDGLPPGGYYVYVEYFDNSEFISSRLANRYNTTVGNSNVVNGSSSTSSQSGSWLGFLPALTEFYNSGESGNGGNGVNPGTAADNSDAASLVIVSAGAVTSNVNIAINIEPANGQTAANRQNPTARATIPNDNYQGTDRITAFLLDGGPDDYYAVRIPPSALPAPPYNVAEGLWIRAGRSLVPYPASLAFEDPGRPGLPDLANLVAASADRVLTGGRAGMTAAGDFIDVRDQWNVTVNQARTIFIVLNQPMSSPGVQYLTEGHFALITCTVTGGTCAGNRVNRTLVTEDGGVVWGLISNGDLFYDLVTETAPPVMVTGASPSSLSEGQTSDVIISGTGFQSGAMVDFGPGIIVNSVTFLGPTQLSVNITVDLSGSSVAREVSVKVANPNVVFPNIARVLTVTPSVDADLDGVPDTQDCAPTSNQVWHPATQVTNVTVGDLGGSTQVAWDSQEAVNGPETSYDVVTGLATSLIPDAGYSSASCAAADHPDTPFIDTSAVAVGTIRYWLVRAANSCNTNPGTYGNGNSGIVPDPRDALDAGGPCP